MTGAYLRVIRDGKWQPIEVEHLTTDERKQHFQNRPAEEILKWMEMLCLELTKTETLLKQLEQDGLISKTGE